MPAGAHHLVGLEDQVLRHRDQFGGAFEVEREAVAACGARDAGLKSQDLRRDADVGRRRPARDTTASSVRSVERHAGCGHGRLGRLLRDRDRGRAGRSWRETSLADGEFEVEGRRIRNHQPRLDRVEHGDADVIASAERLAVDGHDESAPASRPRIAAPRCAPSRGSVRASSPARSRTARCSCAAIGRRGGSPPFPWPGCRWRSPIPKAAPPSSPRKDVSAVWRMRTSRGTPPPSRTPSVKRQHHVDQIVSGGRLRQLVAEGGAEADHHLARIGSPLRLAARRQPRLGGRIDAALPLQHLLAASAGRARCAPRPTAPRTCDSRCPARDSRSDH